MAYDKFAAVDSSTLLFPPTVRANLAGTSPNAIINGGFDIWQRGEGLATATSAANGFVADRWQMFRLGYASGGSTYKPSGPTGIQYAARVQRDSGNTSTAGISLAQSIESVNSIPFAGQAVTLSFYAKAGANYSSASSALLPSIVYGTGTDQNISNGFTGQTNVVSTAVTLTTSWQRFTISGTVSASATQLGVSFYYAPVGTAGASDFFEITGVQLEAGAVATPFRRNANSLQGELAVCQRYFYEPHGGYFLAASTFGDVVIATSGSQCNATVSFPVTMRTKPSLTIASGSDQFRLGYPGTFVISGITFNDASRQQAILTVTSSGLTTGIGYRFYLNANRSVPQLNFSAEL